MAFGLAAHLNIYTAGEFNRLDEIDMMFDIFSVNETLLNSHHFILISFLFDRTVSLISAGTVVLFCGRDISRRHRERCLRPWCVRPVGDLGTFL